MKKIGFELDFFVPCNRGKEIDRYLVRDSKEMLFYPYKKNGNKTVAIDEQEIKLKSHKYYSFLMDNIKRINSRSYFIKSKKKWYELWNQRDLTNFTNEKIITPELSEKNRFAISCSNRFYGDTVCGITIRDDSIKLINCKALLCILNSRLIEWYYKQTTVPKAGGFFIYKVMFLKNIPIRIPSYQIQEQMRLVVEKLQLEKQEKHDADTTHYEKELDRIVYALYELTEDQIAEVERKS